MAQALLMPFVGSHWDDRVIRKIIHELEEEYPDIKATMTKTPQGVTVNIKLMKDSEFDTSDLDYARELETRVKERSFSEI